jgi:hypothetical protein
MTAAGSKNLQFWVVTIGQAHFFQAYWRSYRIGKFTAKRLMSLMLAGAVILSSYYFFLSSAWLSLVTAIYFVLHMYFDERHLNGEDSNANSTLEFVAFLPLYLAPVLYRHFNANVSAFPWILSALLAAFVFFQAFRKRRPMSKTGETLLLWIGLVLISNLFIDRFYIRTMNALVILYHCYRWYSAYAVRTWPKGRQFLAYLSETSFFLVIHLYLGYLFYDPAHDVKSLGVLYSLDSFNICSLLHLVFSTRQGDWGRFWARERVVASTV